MCGFNVFLNLSYTSFEREVIIRKMNDTIVHRGPDGEGIFSSGDLTFGHRRLSIVNTAEGAGQPMTSLCQGFTIVFNGEIYNYAELQRKYTLDVETTSDTRVLLELFAQKGVSILSELVGMFSFVLYDHSKNKLYAVRDRYGIKPLYVFNNRGSILLGSSVKSLIASGLPAKILSKRGLANYLIYQTVYTPNTIFEEISQLQPGHYLEIDCNTMATKKHNYYFPEKHLLSSKKEYINAVRSSIVESVRSQVDAEVKVGLMLSGGIDSSIIALASKIIDRGQDLSCYTVSFTEKSYDEIEYARHLASEFKLNHHELIVDQEYYMKNLQSGMESLDHPSVDGLNTFIITKKMRENGITVILSGLGGDELFGGYYTFGLAEKWRKFRYLWLLPKAIRKLFSKFIKQNYSTKSSSLFAESLLNKYSDFYSVFRQCFSPRELINYSESKDEIVSINEDFNYDRNIFENELQFYCQDILLRDSDQMGMANSVEIRVPFLDHRVVETVKSIPRKYLKPYMRKLFLVSSFDELPDYIWNRPKQGFVIPTYEWLTEEFYAGILDDINYLKEREGFGYDFSTLYPNDHRSISDSLAWKLLNLRVLATYLKSIDELC